VRTTRVWRRLFGVEHAVIESVDHCSALPSQASTLSSSPSWQGPVTRGRRLAPTRPRRRRCRAADPPGGGPPTAKTGSPSACTARTPTSPNEEPPVPFRDARFQFYPRAFTSVQGRADVAVRDGCNPRGLPHAAD